MGRAHYELLGDQERYHGEIPDLPGVYASHKTLEGCRSELQEVLEEWILLRVSRHLDIPELDGIRIAIDPDA